jgi:DNA-binding transcriptional regulator YhcF (GntR family)
LERLGVVSARAGEGTFVSLDAPDATVRDRYLRLEAIAREAVRETEALGFSRFDLTDAIAELPAASAPNEEAAES